jgi:hypothetical protein
MILATSSSRMLRRSKQQRAIGALALLSRDTRSPVIYFRSFTDDVITARGVNSTSWITEEEQLAAVLNKIGPAVAIGEPGEDLPAVGASRFYVPDVQWRDAVRAILPASTLAVLRIGHTESFWWEVEQVIARNAPERILFLVPDNEELYESFRARLASMTPCALPPLPFWQIRKWWRGSLQAVIFFDHSWQATITSVADYQVPFLRRSPAYPLDPILTMILEPVYNSIGVPWKRPEINKRLLLVLFGLALTALLMFPFIYNFDIR